MPAPEIPKIKGDTELSNTKKQAIIKIIKSRKTAYQLVVITTPSYSYQLLLCFLFFFSCCGINTVNIKMNGTMTALSYFTASDINTPSTSDIIFHCLEFLSQ